MKYSRVIGLLTILWPALLTAQAQVRWQKYVPMGSGGLTVCRHPEKIYTSGPVTQSWPVGSSEVEFYSSYGIHPGGIIAPLVMPGDSSILFADPASSGSVFELFPASNKVVEVASFGSVTFEGLDRSGNNLIAASMFTSNDSERIECIDGITKQILWHLPGCGGVLRFSPDGKLLLASSSHQLVLIDAMRGDIIRRFTVFSVAALAWDPKVDGRFAVVGSRNAIVDTSGSIILDNLPFDAFQGTNCFGYSPDGSFIAWPGTFAGRNSVGVYDISKRSTFYVICPFYFDNLSFLNNDTVVISGNYVCLVSVSTRKLFSVLSAGLSEDMAYSKDGKLLFTGAGERWDAYSGEFLGFCAGGNSIAVDSRGSQNVSIGSFGEIWYWNSASDTVLQIRDAISDSTCNSVSSFCSGDSVVAIAISFSNDYASDSRNAVELWNVHSKTRSHQLETNSKPVHALVFSHDGSLLSFADIDSVYIWRVNDGKLLTSFAYSSGNSARVYSFDREDTAILTSGFAVYSLSGKEIQAAHFDDATFDKYSVISTSEILANEYSSGYQDRGLIIIDADEGSVKRKIPILDSVFSVLVASPARNEFAVSGTRLVAYNLSLESKVVSTPNNNPLRFATRRHAISITADNGIVAVYSTSGFLCCKFSVKNGIDVLTPTLANGLYFIVNVGDDGDRHVAKVSLFE